MKITEIFKKQEQTFSFEFFPPQNDIAAVDFGINVGQLMKLNPSFVTVTYGAGGSTQEKTFSIVDYLQNKAGLTCMAHYTCINAPEEKIEKDLLHLIELGIKNLMLLRGDPPKGEERFIPKKGGFNHASDLISFVNTKFDFCKAGACYVDKHPEADSLEKDLQNLRKKVDAGAEFLITQLFFINDNYFRFLELTKKAGINCRIIPGILPITSYRQIERFTKMTAARIPQGLIGRIEEYKDNPVITHQIGVEYTIQQCRELLEKGAPGIHFYTLNKSRAAVEIFEMIK